jgi:hypothetical protein
MLGKTDRIRAEAERDMAMAHTIASFTRATKLEPLERYLRPAAPRSIAEKLRTWAARAGATVTISDRKE